MISSVIATYIAATSYKQFVSSTKSIYINIYIYIYNVMEEVGLGFEVSLENKKGGYKA